MSLESVMGAILSVEWFLGASMALAFERGVRSFVNSRVFESDAEDTNDRSPPEGA